MQVMRGHSHTALQESVTNSAGNKVGSAEIRIGEIKQNILFFIRKFFSMASQMYKSRGLESWLGLAANIHS